MESGPATNYLILWGYAWCAVTRLTAALSSPVEQIAQELIMAYKALSPGERAVGIACAAMGFVAIGCRRYA